MPASRFEETLLREMEACVQSLLSIQTTDPAVARLQARRAGLEVALKQFRQINKIDDEGDEA